MKWMILVALFACTTHKAPVESPTESNAKPVSPLTVEPCYCMKMFMPVCADGQSYGNSCEAECHGHKKWTEGSCPQPQKKK